MFERGKKPILSFSALCFWLIFVNFFQLWMASFGICIGLVITAFIPDKEYGRVGQRWNQSENSQLEESTKNEKKDFNIISHSKDGKKNIFNNTGGAGKFSHFDKIAYIFPKLAILINCDTFLVKIGHSWQNLTLFRQNWPFLSKFDNFFVKIGHF